MRIHLRTAVSAAAASVLLAGLIGCASHLPAHDMAARSHVVASHTPTPTPTPKIETTTVEETAAIPFASTTVNDGSIPAGQTRVTTAGVAGVLTTTYRVTTTDGVETSRTQISQVTTTAPISQVTAVGTYVAPPPPPPPPAAPAATTRTVIPGGFCSPSDQGVTAVAANGHSYTCGGKGPDASGHLHWNS